MSFINKLRDSFNNRFLSSIPEDRIRIEAAKRSGDGLSGTLTIEGKHLLTQSFKEWKNAVEYASDRERPIRIDLMDVYDAVKRDLHLMGVVETRILSCQLSKFIINDANGEPNDDLKKLFNATWFREFVKIAMMSIFEGTKVIEVFHVKDDGKIKQVDEIPASHIIHYKGIVVKEAGQEKGIPYKEGMYKNYVIQIGKDFDLGIFAELAPIPLAKKIANGGWLSYIDKFGTPPVTVTTEDRTVERQKQLLDMLKNLVSSHYGVLQGNEKMEVLNGTFSDAHNVFDKFIDRCNSEMSKRISGATGTTDEKSFVGSAQVHAEIAKLRHVSDKLFLAEIVNEELIPRLINLSPVYAPLAGHTFEYDNSDELSMREIIEAISKLGQIYEMDIEIIAEKTGLPITGLRKIVQKIDEANPDGSQKKKDKTEAVTLPEISAHYESCGCGDENHQNINALDLNKWSSTIDRIAKELHSGKLNPNDLDQELIQKTSDELTDAQRVGWGKDIEKIDYKSTDWETNRKLRANLYKFSGAKTWQQLKDMHFYLYDENGKIRSFPDFKKDVLKVHQAYNVNHLDAEYSTAVKSAQHAKDWQGYEDDKQEYPNLRYLTAGDDRVRDAHQVLDDMVRPVNDEFWDSFYPPNGYRCRCYVEPTTDEPTEEAAGDVDVKPSFLNNVGKTQKIFGSKHPYFVVPVDDRSLVMNAFEKMVDADDFYLNVKVYKNGGTLDVHPLHNEAENVEIGRLLALKGYKVKLRPEIKNDGKQPDVWLDRELSDIKRPTSLKAIENRLRKANQQECSSAIIEMDNDWSIDEFANRLNGCLVKPERKQNISFVILIRGNKVAKVTRKNIYDKELMSLLLPLFK